MGKLDLLECVDLGAQLLNLLFQPRPQLVILFARLVSGWISVDVISDDKE